MIDALLILAGGLLGSSHCVGMCGGFVLTLGAAQKNFRRNLLAQLVYNTGRVSTYAAAGAAAGFGGWRLGREFPSAVWVQAALSVLAGSLLLWQGLVAAGVLPRLRWHGRSCPGAAEFAALLRSGRPGQVFAAGVFNGLLPCGLVYAYLSLAATTGHVLPGMLVMLLFGLGTFPALVLTGAGGGLLGGGPRRAAFRLAAWCMVLTGAVTLARGLGFLPLFGLAETVPPCPFGHV